ncbi:hypothetical protein F4801DRAFT_385692 [Xylaria longipes]|nr:hypothetical protein F4801DRAFT_385692 [Xylaria longipes]
MSPSTSRKRKLPSTWDIYESEQILEAKKPRNTSGKKETKAADGEKRLRRFRAKRRPASKSFTNEQPSNGPYMCSLGVELRFLLLMLTPIRFYVLNRSRCGTANCPEEDVEITGSTGNIYKVHIAQVPSCNCPHALNGNQCKHIIYVMSRVLRARPDLVYQLGLLSTELCEIFEGAPSIGVDGEKSNESHDPNRKQIEGDCPICFTPFEGAEDTVYCRATCGQNIHKECFQMWATTKRQSARDAVTCPMCRSPWQGDEDMVKKIKNTGIAGADGYVNVAGQLGISGTRDYSTYYNGPSRRQDSQGFGFGFGYRRWR